METRNINLLVYDKPENFNKTKSLLGYEGSTLKRIICIENATHFDSILENQLNDDDLIFLVVHVFALENIKGIKEFIASGIKDSYPKLEFMFISDGASDIEIQKQMLDAKIPVTNIYRYHDVIAELKADKYNVYNKKELIQKEHIPITSNGDLSKQETTIQCDYVIITALEENEMEKVLPMIQKVGKIENRKHLIEYGHLKSNTKKKIAYASQLSTGMVDASILATELILQFKPKFLIRQAIRHRSNAL